MNLFTKRETLIQNITLMAIVAAINVLIAVIIAFSWGFAAILTIFLPFLSAAVAIYCKKKYYPIYLVSNLLLSVVVTLWNLETTLFYVLPAIFTGFIFGVFSEIKIHPVITILVASLIQLGLSYLSIWLIDLIYEVNMVADTLALFGLENNTLANYLVPSIIFFFSVVQILLSYIIFRNEYKKVDRTRKNETFSYILTGSITLLSLVILIPCYFFNLETAYLMGSIIIYLGIGVLVKDIANLRKYSLFAELISIIISIILFAIIYPYMKADSGLLLAIIFPILIFIVSFLCSFLKKGGSKDKINDAR